jgi:hypothetical protein
MEKLLVDDEVPTSFFGLFNLFELHQEQVVELLKVLFHVLQANFGRHFKSNIVKLTISVLFLML